MNCPKCGSNLVNSEYKGAFSCGTLTDRNGWYHQTNFCKEFAELRKPLDAQIQQLKSQRDALKARVARLEEAGDRIEKLATGYINLLKAFQHTESHKEAVEDMSNWKQAKEPKP